jgi:hypothetical protein
MLAYLRLELARMLRSPRLYVFTVAVPVGLYLIFTSVGDAREASATLAPYAMVAMVRCSPRSPPHRAPSRTGPSDGCGNFAPPPCVRAGWWP